MIRFPNPSPSRSAAAGRLFVLPVILCLLAVPPMARAENLALVYSATASGRTTGHIATLEITNPGDEGRRVYLKPSVIPATNGFQGYVIPTGTQIEVRQGSKVIILLKGYGTDVRRPPVPEGQLLPHPNEWIEPEAPRMVKDLEITEDGPYREVEPRPEGAPILTAPGTTSEFPLTIDLNQYPAEAAPFLVTAVQRIEEACNYLLGGGTFDLPTGDDPDDPGAARREVVQQTFWIYTAGLRGRAYTRDDYLRRRPQSAMSEGGAPPAAAETDAETSLDPWELFRRVGLEARVWKGYEPGNKPSS